MDITAGSILMTGHWRPARGFYRNRKGYIRTKERGADWKMVVIALAIILILVSLTRAEAGHQDDCDITLEKELAAETISIDIKTDPSSACYEKLSISPLYVQTSESDSEPLERGTGGLYADYQHNRRDIRHDSECRRQRLWM